MTKAKYKYPKNRIKIHRLIFGIVWEEIKRNKGFHGIVASGLSADRIVRLIQNNYRRKKR